MPESVTLSWAEYTNLAELAEEVPRTDDPRVASLEARIKYLNATVEDEREEREGLEDELIALRSKCRQETTSLAGHLKRLTEEYDLEHARSMARQQELDELDELLKTNELQANIIIKMEAEVKELRKKATGGITTTIAPPFVSPPNIITSPKPTWTINNHINPPNTKTDR